MDETTPPLAGLSPISGKRLDARFDGGQLSSDGGVVLLREIEQRLRVADRLAACIKDPRAGSDHTQPCPYYPLSPDDDRVRVRGWQRCLQPTHRSMFKLALDLVPSDRALCSRPIISRLENLPDTRALFRRGVLWRSVMRQLSYGSQARHLGRP